MSIDVQSSLASIEAVPGQAARLKFTVRNMTEGPLEVVGVARAEAPTPDDWVHNDSLVVDRPQRNLGAGAMDEFVVTITPPVPTPPGSYPFHLRVSPTDTDAVQIWGDSPQVSVVVADAEAPAPSELPKWLALAAAVVLGLILGNVAFEVFDNREKWTSTLASTTTLQANSTQRIGVTTDGESQLLEFRVADNVRPSNVSITEGPFALLPLGAGIEDGQDCADALAEQSDANQITTTQPIPIDGRILCLYEDGTRDIAAIRVLEVSNTELAVAVTVWSLSK